MNIPSERLEQLLRKAPAPLPPADLLDDLKAEIILPRAGMGGENGYRRPSLFRRWLPVLSLTLWLLACLVLLGVQYKHVLNLREATARLSAQADQALSSLPDPAGTGNEELTRLRADHTEVERLRAEVQRLTEELAVLNGLRAENERLAMELNGPGNAEAPRDFIATLAEKSDLIKCVSNLKQVGLATRLYSNDHGDVKPLDFASLRNELPNEAVTFCPGSNGSVRYEILAPGGKEEDASVVFARCPVHNNVLLMDGSVQQLGTRLKVIIRDDGKPIIGR